MTDCEKVWHVMEIVGQLVMYLLPAFCAFWAGWHFRVAAEYRAKAKALDREAPR
jgi:hypothetical protein